MPRAAAPALVSPLQYQCHLSVAGGRAGPSPNSALQSWAISAVCATLPSPDFYTGGTVTVLTVKEVLEGSGGLKAPGTRLSWANR